MLGATRLLPRVEHVSDVTLASATDERQPRSRSAGRSGTIAGMTPTRALALTGVVVAVAAAGCGGHSKPSATTTTTAAAPAVSPTGDATTAQGRAYTHAMQALGTQLGSILARVGNTDQSLVSNNASLQGKNQTAAIAVQLRIAQRGLQQAATKLAAIKPPADVRAAHDALRKAVLEYAVELNPIIASVLRGSIGSLAEISSLKGVTGMEKASAEITAKGYSIL